VGPWLNPEWWETTINHKTSFFPFPKRTKSNEEFSCWRRKWWVLRASPPTLSMGPCQNIFHIQVLVTKSISRSSLQLDSLMNLIQELQCRVTYWVLVEMLLLLRDPFFNSKGGTWPAPRTLTFWSVLHVSNKSIHNFVKLLLSFFWAERFYYL